MEVRSRWPSGSNWSSKYKIEKQKLDNHEGIRGRPVGSRRKSQIEKLKAQWQLKKQQVDELTIRAGHGRMQEMTLQVGPEGEAGRCAGEGRAALEAEGAS